MPRKAKEEAIPLNHYAAGTKMVRGKIEWIWKPIDAAYLKWCEEQREKANGNGLKVRQRTRKR